MTRALLVCCLGLVGCATAGIARGTGEVKEAVVYIDSCGTGWMVREDFVVTNRHVADCVTYRTNGNALVVFSSGVRVRGSVFSVSSGRFVDLALIKLADAVGGPRLRLAEEGALRDRDELLSFGNPHPSRWVPSSYRVVSRPRPGLPGVIVLEGTASHGDSGSPVVTRDGRVVGVLFGRSQGHAYAVPVRPYLVDLLETIPRASSPFYYRNGQKR